MKKNKITRYGSDLGLSQYHWQNGGKRKMPKGVGAPIGEVKANININYNPYYTRETGGLQ